METHRPSVPAWRTVRPMPAKRQRRRWFLRQWREYRNLSQEKLADRVGLTQGMISQLEGGKVNFTAEHLDILSEALMCEPADLLVRNPQDPEAPWSIWETLAPAQKVQAIEIMKALKKTANG
jgi:transcriptional regulator with XRE-family HTH domain